jgi:glycosyltransferase involved in cell wall biosynthesis
LNESSGVGQAGRLTIKALAEAGFECISHDLAPCYRRVVKSDGSYPAVGRGGVWLIHANAQESLIALMAFPSESWESRYRIAYWAWETTRASSLWAWAAQFFHEIWVPSRFVFDALEQSLRATGRERLLPRLRIMPHPVTGLTAVRSDRRRFGLDPDAFETLCLFNTRSTATRKNPWAALDAWTQAFPEPNPKARLRLKVQNLGEDAQAQARLETLCDARPDISTSDEAFDESAMMAFMASFDAILSLHRSEGFGLTLAEAMALGVAPIATGWSGNMDFMRDDNSYPVPYDLIPVRDPSGLYGGLFGRADPSQLWAEPKTAEAARILRRAAADPARAQRAKAARSTIAALGEAWSAKALSALPMAKFIGAAAP